MKITWSVIFSSLLLIVVLFTSCSQGNESPQPSTPQQLQTKKPSTDWDALNRLLREVYGIPPVSSTRELKLAALVVSESWFKKADNSVKILEKNDIPWERTSPFFYLFYYYILHHTQLMAASDPIEFMAADFLLATSIKELNESADLLISMKRSGEKLKIFSTQKEADAWFENFDKDYFKQLKEYTDKIKK